ncbi:signal peptidase I [Alkaliphilus sp. B6464]|uniref:signal peptidase I n=1 Tax=Alkaliphilus sp. B6464 TaxID=2731219 RepID=UPI001BAC66DC|nr:signal peptidase I [Alkaliphilus sp. B6464]QUH22125.1 signal peptidase I [Alkaliphilus sp. B6464]
MKSKNSKLIKFIYPLLVILILIYVYKYVIINANIPTNSMQPTLNPGDKIIVNQFFYRYFATPKRFDVLVFKFPENESMLYVKRVIGLPKDKIEIKEGQLYINNEKINESYLNENFQGNYGPYIIPDDHYFFFRR